MTTTDPRTVVLRYFDALAAGDQETIRESWSEDGTCWYGGDLPISGTWRGRDQVIDGSWPPPSPISTRTRRSASRSRTSSARANRCS
ncbi:hypothetical protein AB0N93_20170 [Streptomyces sp. NPDC091267]|uniref:nuclear transport factor 2 family protein n=1 Tax=Streptomyces sp. NPDC091267 TaxID=3155195 RepID=UPI0034264522